MSRTGSKWRIDSPVDGFDAGRAEQFLAAGGPMARIYQPEAYEPRYPYPLLVLFHPQGGNEEQALDLMPQLSRRNYVAVSIRGPQMLGLREDGQLSCGWGYEDHHSDVIQEHILKSVESVRKTYNVHTERVFFLGFCEGAGAAYRAAFAMADRIGGLIALNGQMPRAMGGAPLFRPNVLRNLPVFLGHGLANPIVPYKVAEKDHMLLFTAGADVTLKNYIASHRVESDMLRDVNRWIIDNLETCENRRFTMSG